jgi:hypothetical protein
VNPFVGTGKGIPSAQAAFPTHADCAFGVVIRSEIVGITTRTAHDPWGLVVRRLFTTEEARRRGIGPAELRWGERTGRWRRIERGVYGEGPQEPTALERAVAVVIVTGGVASGTLAGVLHRLDGVELDGVGVTIEPGRRRRCAGVHRRPLAAERVAEVDGIRCTDGLQTLLDLAALIDDLRWEQALESALRRRLVDVGRLDVSGVVGAARIRRVLTLRPAGAPPTGSLLETLMVQLVRTLPAVPEPSRQVEVRNSYDEFVACVDLAWPDLGLFVELDGQQHKDQPVYDARRETAVVAATGWLCGRFTWSEVVGLPRSTGRRVVGLVDQARRRPLAG